MPVTMASIGMGLFVAVAILALLGAAAWLMGWDDIIVVRSSGRTGQWTTALAIGSGGAVALGLVEIGAVLAGIGGLAAGLVAPSGMLRVVGIVLLVVGILLILYEEDDD